MSEKEKGQQKCFIRTNIFSPESGNTMKRDVSRHFKMFSNELREIGGKRGHMKRAISVCPHFGGKYVEARVPGWVYVCELSQR